MDARRQQHTHTVLAVVLGFFAVGACDRQVASALGTTTFVLDGNRMYATLDFVRPDGTLHRALAFVDMGSASMVVRIALFRELQLDQRKPLSFKVGRVDVEAPAAAVESDAREPSSIGAEFKVEGVLPASVLQRFAITIDYQRHTLTFASSGTMTAPEGVPVPFHQNPITGLIAVDVSIGGNPYALTIDNGSAYTWVNRHAVNGLLARHPEWVRGVGAVGASNMMMSGESTETSGTLLRIPMIECGPMRLHDVGVLAAGPGRGPDNVDFFDWYAQKNAVPVIGWIGGNVLKQFRLTIDYANHVSYWQRQRDADVDDLDQVGLTLRWDGHRYIVAAVATKTGQPTVEGIQARRRPPSSR